MPVKELYDEHVLWGELRNKQSKSGSGENCSRLKRLRRGMERHLLIWACKKCFWISKKSRMHYALEYFAHAYTCMLNWIQGKGKTQAGPLQNHC